MFSSEKLVFFNIHFFTCYQLRATSYELYLVIIVFRGEEIDELVGEGLDAGEVALLGEVGEVAEEVAGFGGGEGGVEGVVVEELLGLAVGIGELGHEIGQDDGADAGAVGFLDESQAPDGVDVVDGVDDESHITLLNDIPQHVGGADDLDAVDTGALFARVVIQNPHHGKGAWPGWAG